MGQIQVLGLSPTGKVPAALFAVNKGVGRVSASQIPRYLLLVGNMTTGTAVADTNVYDVFPNTDVAALFGARSELAQMIAVARLYAGINIKAIAVTESGGAAATITLTFAGGNAGAAGTWTFYFCGETISVAVAKNDTPTTQAAAFVSAFNAFASLPASAANVNGVVTITIANKGPRGNDYAIYQDPTAATNPTTTTATITTTSTAGPNSDGTLHSGPGGVLGYLFGGGTTVDNVTTALATLAGTEYFTVCFAQSDTATNVPLLKTYRTGKAAIGTQLYEQIVLGQTADLTAAKTLSSTTLGTSDAFSVAWQRYGQMPPPVLAASYAALRHQAEQVQPNSRFDGNVLLGIPPQIALVDRPSVGDGGEEDSALNNGLTPITSAGGNSVVVRAVNTLCLKNSQPFYGVLDCGESRTPDVAAEELQLAWNSEFVVANPYVRDDPAPGEKIPPGVATPSIWTGYASRILSAHIADKWFESVTVTSEFDSASGMILTQIDVQVMPQNHRIAGNINQVTG